MMRILSWTLFGIGFVLYGSLAARAAGMELNRVTAAEEWKEGEASKATLRLNADGEWDWLRLGLAGKFFITPLDDQYSSLEGKLVLPAIANDLAIKTGYEWNKKYTIYDVGIDYGFQPLKPVSIQFGYQTEERIPELVTGCPYDLNNEFIACTWEQESWKYSFKLTRNDKNYFQDPQYTSLKYQLTEKLNYSPWPAINFQIEYNEGTGDYIAASYKDYWKQEWAVKGGYETQSHWQYDWEYSKLYWERGFEAYRSDQKVQLKAGKRLNPNTKIMLSAICYDLNYFSAAPDYSEPGVYNPIETDVKSRVVNKLGLEIQFQFPHYSWQVGSFLGNFRYDAGYTMERTGIYGTFTWKLRQVDLSLKAAPVGDNITQDAYYKLEIAYRPE
jgi:hypothetical protein